VVGWWNGINRCWPIALTKTLEISFKGFFMGVDFYGNLNNAHPGATVMSSLTGLGFFRPAKRLVAFRPLKLLELSTFSNPTALLSHIPPMRCLR